MVSRVISRINKMKNYKKTKETIRQGKKNQILLAHVENGTRWLMSRVEIKFVLVFVVLNIYKLSECKNSQKITATMWQVSKYITKHSVSCTCYTIKQLFKNLNTHVLVYVLK